MDSSSIGKTGRERQTGPGRRRALAIGVAPAKTFPNSVIPTLRLNHRHFQDSIQTLADAERLFPLFGSGSGSQNASPNCPARGANSAPDPGRQASSLDCRAATHGMV